MKDTTPFNTFVDSLERLLNAEVDAYVDMLGESPGQKPISSRMAMKIYESLTDQEITALQQKHGAEKVSAYIVDMERRRRRGSR